MDKCKEIGIEIFNDYLNFRNNCVSVLLHDFYNSFSKIKNVAIDYEANIIKTSLDNVLKESNIKYETLSDEERHKLIDKLAYVLKVEKKDLLVITREVIDRINILNETIIKKGTDFKKYNIDEKNSVYQLVNIIKTLVSVNVNYLTVLISKLNDPSIICDFKIDTSLSISEIIGITLGDIKAAQYLVDDVDRFVTPRGHGFAAEQMNDYWDKLHGKKATVVGGNNEKNGADRVVDGIEIQTKYCNNGSKCVSECFEDGKFRYIGSDGKPMQVEVPSDKYDDAVKAMEERIRKGQVPGVDDPKEAKNIVRKGNFTYEQARNATRFGTIESLSLDAVNGAIVAGYAFGISAAMNFAVAIWNGEPFNKALKSSAQAGLKVAGPAFVTTVLSAQLEKTALNSVLRGSTDKIVQIMGPKAASYIANAFRTSGRQLSGAAAMQSASKILRSNVVTGVITVAVLSTFDVADMFRGRISGKQLFKNVTNTAAAVAGGGGGAYAGAIAGAAAGSFIPIVGNVAGGIIGGFLGGLAGGAAAGKAASTVLDGMIEDDAVEMEEIIQDEFQKLASDYLVNKKEAESICDKLASKFDGDFLKDMFESSSRHGFARRKLEPLFEDVAKKRKKIKLPTNEEMAKGLKEVIEDFADDDRSATKVTVAKVCNKCGEPVTGKGKFCSNCGATIQ